MKSNNKENFNANHNTDFPSVTTILKKTQPIDSRVRYYRWRKKVGNYQANSIITNSCERGKALDIMLEKYSKNNSIQCHDPKIQPFWNSLQPVLAKISDIRLVEQVVINRKECYKARVDWVARYQGIPHTIEFTSSEKAKLELFLEDKILQVVANCGAVNRYYDTSLFGHRIKKVLVVVALPKLKAQVISLDIEKIINYWYQWQERLDIFYQLVA